MKTKVIEEDINDIILEFKDALNVFKNKTILITGANGFIPSYFVDLIDSWNKKSGSSCKLILINKNQITKNSRLGHLINNKNIKLITQDVGKKFNLEDKVDIIIHAASRATVSSNLENPIDTIDANVNGLRTLLDYAKESGVEQFIFFSSAEIYGNPLKEFLPTPEEYFGNVDCTGKRACYGESKRFCETLCQDFYRAYNIPVKILRIFNTYGPGLRNDGKLIAEFFERSLKEGKIYINSKGLARRSFSYISDVIRAMLFIILKGEIGQSYNVGNETNNLTVKEIAELTKKTINKDIDIIFDYKTPEPKIIGVDNRYPDITKLRKLGFLPKISLEVGLKRMLRWYNEQDFYQ